MTKTEIEVLRLQAKEHEGCRQTTRARRSKEWFSYMLQNEQDPADNFILDFQPPEQWDNKFLLFKATQYVVLCYSSPRKLDTYLNGFSLIKYLTCIDQDESVSPHFTISSVFERFYKFLN